MTITSLIRARKRNLAVLVPVFVAAALPLHGVSASATNPTAIPAWVNALPHVAGGLYDQPDSVLAANGYLVYHPVRVDTLWDGGADFVYSVNGVERHYPVPPRSFHWLTAPNTELDLYGLPHRPSGGPQLQLWTEAASAFREVVPTKRLVVSDNRVHHLPTTVPHGGTATGSNDPTRTGYFDQYTQSPLVQVTWAQMYWTEPAFTPCNDGKNWEGTLWPGIQNTQSVTQDGTQTIHETGFLPIDHQVWYETFPQQASVPGPMTIPAGHAVYAAVTHSDNATTSHYVVEDVTTGSTWIPSPDPTSIMGAGVINPEWMLERTPGFDVPQFSTFSVRGYWGGDNGESGGVGDFVYKVTPYIMIGVNSPQDAVVSTLQNPSNTSLDTFQIQWKGCN